MLGPTKEMLEGFTLEDKVELVNANHKQAFDAVQHRLGQRQVAIEVMTYGDENWESLGNFRCKTPNGVGTPSLTFYTTKEQIPVVSDTTRSIYYTDSQILICTFEANNPYLVDKALRITPHSQ